MADVKLECVVCVSLSSSHLVPKAQIFLDISCICVIFNSAILGLPILLTMESIAISKNAIKQQNLKTQLWSNRKTAFHRSTCYLSEKGNLKQLYSNLCSLQRNQIDSGGKCYQLFFCFCDPWQKQEEKSGLLIPLPPLCNIMSQESASNVPFQGPHISYSLWQFIKKFKMHSSTNKMLMY